MAKTLLIPSIRGNGGGMGSVLDMVGSSETYGYVDPYSGKTYGSIPYEQLVAQARTTQSNLSQRLNAPSYSMSGSNLNQLYSPNGMGMGMASLAIGGNEPRQTLGQYLTSTLAAIKIPDKDKYVYQPDMDKSYGKYANNWNKYWEGSYKNPRIAEANAAMRNPNTQEGQQVQETRAQASLRIPKAVGTGISSTGSLNPFGTLDAGLNI